MPSAVDEIPGPSCIASMCKTLALVVVIGLLGAPAHAESGLPVDSSPGSYVINLMSALNAMEADSFASVATASTHRIYSTTVEIDGRTWHRIRLGFFATKAEAAAVLAELRDDYPEAWVTRVSDRERAMFAGEAATDQAGPEPVVDIAMPERPAGRETAGAPLRDPLRKLVRRQDERRPDSQFRTTLFNRPLTIGGKYEVSPERRNNYDLDRADDRDLTRVNQEFRLDMLYKPGPSLIIFLEPQLVHSRDSRSDREAESEFDVLRGQSWVYYAFLPDAGLALQVGRQLLQERRSWWWDIELDAARLHFSTPAALAELGIAKEILPEALDDDIRADQEDITRVFARWDWKWASRQHLEFFALSERDRSGFLEENTAVSGELLDTRDADLDWFGARAIGRWKRKPLGTLFYWADLAAVRGTETLTDFSVTDDGAVVPGESRRIDVRGWALDAGVTLRPRANRELSFTAGYAIGSGDDGADATLDRSFRQTGLNTNKDNYRGVTRFRYYGELLRPELSNLQVLTFAVGRRFLSSSSIDLVYHNYRQVYANPILRSGRIRAGLDGQDKDIGSEIDLVIGVEEWRQWDLKVTGSMFLAGDAYGPNTRERAYRADLQVRYVF